MAHTRPHVALDGHYSITEAAALLGKNRTTLYRWRDMGFLKVKKHRYNHLPFVLGREILRIFDAYE